MTSDSREYRDYLVAEGRAPATVNRAITSVRLFVDACGCEEDNPFRRIDLVEEVERPPRALTRNKWNAVRR